MEIFNMGPGDVPGALSEGRLDAIGGYGSNFQTLPGWLQQVDAQADLKVIDMEEEYRDVIRNNPKIGYDEIEPYGWEQDIGIDEKDYDTIATFLFQMQFGFGDNISEEVAYEFVSQSYENVDAIRDVYESYPNYEENPGFGPNGLTTAHPVHPGAARYYQEIDQWRDDLEVADIE
jgi:TRAP-type uncharacterized transport system substrate-binding protein